MSFLDNLSLKVGKSLKKVFGDSNTRSLKAIEPIVSRINELEPSMQSLTDEQLGAKTPEFKQRLEQGQVLDDLMPEAFAVVREVSRRRMGMRHFDVQLIGGTVLHQGKIAEMTTGEGKTLVATLPTYLNALAGKGVHVVTVNDYLARRDAEWMSPIFHGLGMTIGAIQSGMDSQERLPIYACDVTYGTNNEFGFDYLRDNMKVRAEDQVQKQRFFAIVDEVDSILIDEARTPLIISGMPTGTTDKYMLADQISRKLRKDEHFEIKEKEHAAVLTEEGIERAEKLAGVDSFYTGANMDWPHHIEQSLKAHFLYSCDKEYVVQNNEIIIVDEFTGRLMPGRRWSDGLHQAVEAKERIKPREELQTLATITLQNYFKLYKKLAGMTGTAQTEAAEFYQIYKLDVMSIPTNRPLQRSSYPDVVYRTKREKIKALLDEIQETHEAGRPSLVGTIAIEDSEQLADLLKRRGIPHNVLNAKYHEKEAQIIAQAGRKGAVTIATNMAGRGTDILLGGNPEFLARGEVGAEAEEDVFQVAVVKFKKACENEKQEVLAAGGLHVVGTERHEARRIDNQLRGRCGRQGDPGSSRFFLSLEDTLMRIFAPEWVSGMLERLGMTEGTPIESRIVSRRVETAQKKVEQRNFDVRKNLLEYDEVMDKQRKKIYGDREEILHSIGLKEKTLDMIQEVVYGSADTYLGEGKKGDPAEWDLPGLCEWFERKFANPAPDGLDNLAKEAVEDSLISAAKELYEKREAEIGSENMRRIERYLLLNAIDSKWKDHLYAMDALKTGIGLRGYGQVDPKLEYKREGFEKFQMLLDSIADEVTELVYRVQVKKEEERQLVDAMAPSAAQAQHADLSGYGETQRLMQEAVESSQHQGGPTTVKRKVEKVGRNAPCTCGSGKKFKNCCGRGV